MTRCRVLAEPVVRFLERSMWKTFSPVVVLLVFQCVLPAADQPDELARARVSGGATLTAKDVRVCVTGFDHNRPKPFDGMGDFIGWAEGIQRLPNGDILLIHSAGYDHVSFASPRDIRGKTGGFLAPTGGRSMHADRPTTARRGQSRSLSLIIDWTIDPTPCSSVATAPCCASST